MHTDSSFLGVPWPAEQSLNSFPRHINPFAISSLPSSWILLHTYFPPSPCSVVLPCAESDECPYCLYTLWESHLISQNVDTTSLAKPSWIFLLPWGCRLNCSLWGLKSCHTHSMAFAYYCNHSPVCHITITLEISKSLFFGGGWEEG